MQVDLSTAAALACHWGKACPAPVPGAPAHHTVLGHSLDVAACAYVLLERHPALLETFAAASCLRPKHAAASIAAVVSLHDIGKFDVRFARKAPAVADVLRPATSGIPAGRYDHGTEGFRQIEQDDDSYAQLHEELGNSAMSLLRSVTGHHGSLPTRDAVDPSRAALPPSLVREDVAARRAFVGLVCAYFRKLGAELPWPSAVDGPMVQRLAGLAAVADWLGSDVAHFPYRPGPIVDIDSYWAESCERAARASQAAGLLRAKTAVASFETLFPGYVPRDVQILTELVGGEAPALVIVEAEMGKGKTEAALSLAARFLAHGNGEGVTVALPTMATSNAMFARIEDFSPRLYPGADVHLTLAHSRASRHSSFAALVQRDLHALDADAPEASVACARWLLNRKRVLLAQMGVGTIDQALQAALTVRHQFVRLFGLSRNVVVIDEVHAYDAYMEVLLEHLLSWLGALRVPVILLSATLPSLRRAMLANAWRGDIGVEPVVDPPDAALARPYPLVTVATADGMTTLGGAASTTARSITLERVERHDAEVHLQETAARLIDAARRGARVAWVRNTVTEAQQAFAAIVAARADVEQVLFHARFRGGDRREIEGRVLERFGKHAPEGGRVLIATQVVEQSLDLDFDELHTDIAPIDLMLQRVGRLHRHGRPRPSDFREPRLVVHGPCDADAEALRYGPSSYVYDVGTLWLADQATRVRRCLVLPADIRRLVEESYHPELRRARLEQGPGRLLDLETSLVATLEGKRAAARRCCIAPTTADADGASVMDDDDDAVRAFTRDGRSSTVLPLLWDGCAGRTLDLDSARVPSWMLDASANDAWRLVGELMDQTISLAAPLEARVPASERQAWDIFQARFRGFSRETGLGNNVMLLPLRADEAGFTGQAYRGRRPHVVHYSSTLGLRVYRSEEASA